MGDGVNICTGEILRLLQGRQLWSHGPRAVKWGRMSFLAVGNCGVERNSVSASRGGCPADKGRCVGKQSWGVSWENDCKILNAGLCPCVAPAVLGKSVSYHTAPCCIKKIKNKTNPKPRCPFVLHPWKAFSFWEQVMCLSLTTLLFSCIPIFLYFKGRK